MFEATEKALAKFKAALDAVRNSKKTPEQIEKAKELYNSLDPSDRSLLEYIFPEVVESEDERIRKEIVNFIRWAIDRGSITNEQRERSDTWITYLEQQKENPKTVDSIPSFCVSDVEWADTIVVRAIVALSDDVDYNRDEPCKYKREIDDLKKLRDVLCWKKEQQPAEWSEEDLQHESWILECLADGKRTMPQYAADFHAAYNWLKSLRPSWKPSNLELGALRTAISVLTEERNFQRAGKHLQDILDHFEGKETRHDWKPSEEQIKALERLAKYPFDNDELSLANREHLAELVSQLKKLM